jgi:predicted ribosome quality control (RQC) complex YloA/Tae2 family protein
MPTGSNLSRDLSVEKTNCYCVFEISFEKLAFWERMKALSIPEIDTLLAHLQPMVGARVQQIFVSERDIALQFYQDRGVQWLMFDMNPRAPVLLSQSSGPRRQPKTTPALLFLRSHFLGKKLKKLVRDEHLGRVVHLEFADDQPLHIEVRLFPHGQNMILRAGEKIISLLRPKELREEVRPQSEGHGRIERTVKEVEEEWLRSRQQSTTSPNTPKAKAPSREQRLQKLKKAIAQIQDSIVTLNMGRFELAGQKLLELQSVPLAYAQAPEEVSLELSLAQNIQNCFEAHKKHQVKVSGAAVRLADLQAEFDKIQLLNDAEYEDFVEQLPTPSSKTQRTPGKNVKVKELKTRKTTVGRGWEVWVGRSGKDNLALLRRARAWDYWLHIKDEPGAHAILFRNKTEVVTDAVLMQAAQFLLFTSKEKSKSNLEGGAFEFLVAEVRHVQPIKGDRLGRVNVRESRTLSVRYHSKNATRK